MLSISCFINNQKVNITKHIIKFQLHKNLIIIPSKYMENHITKNLIYVHLNKKNYIADNNYYIFIDLINSKVYTSNQTNNVYVNFNEIISKKKIINQIFE
jgi:hypothetical protein